MKILFLSHYSFLYGSNRSLDSLIDYFSEHGYEVEVLLPSKGEFYKHLSRKKVKVSTFMFLYEVLYYKANVKYLSLPLLWLYDFVVFPLLVLKVKHISPDIIYSNSSADLFSVWIAKLLKIKHVIHIREFMEEDFGGRCIIGKKMKRKILLKSDKVVCVSQAVANTVIGNLPYYAKVIYNGLPINIAECEYPDFSKNLRIGVVGNIDVSKQQGLAINYMPEILSVFPHATLHIIGDKECSYKRFILNRVHDLHLEDYVVFEGFFKNVDDIYRKFDVLLMCSRSEAFGRVTIEAMIRRKPVIGYMSGGTNELIEQGVTGFKFKDVADVISALRIYVEDELATRNIIDKAQEVACKKFSEENYTRNVFQFLNNDSWQLTH